MSTPIDYKLFSEAKAGTTQHNIFQFIQEKLPIYEKYLDGNFKREFEGSQFLDRYWELLLCTLMTENCSADVQKPKYRKNTSNYDFDVTINGHTFALEATVVHNATTGGDIVPSDEDLHSNPSLKHDAYTIKPDKIQLRVATRIDEKNRQYERLIQGGNIAPDKPYVVAVNLNGLLSAYSQLTSFFDLATSFLGSFFETGHPLVYYVKPGNNGGVETNNIDISQMPNTTYKSHNIKANNTLIGKNIFTNPRYSNISAVLLSQSRADGAIMRQYEPGMMLYNDLILVHNPFAKNKLPQGLIPVAQEYVASFAEGSVTIKKIIKPV